MIKKLKIFLENKESNDTFVYKRISDNEAKEWLRNVKPVAFNLHELSHIKELIDFKLKDGVIDYSYNYIILNKGVIYSLNRDFYLICLGNENKTNNYYCKSLTNLLIFIRQKLVIK